MAVTDEFLNYTGGIFRDTSGITESMHDVSIVGWGVDELSGTKYWIGRNSWGTYWGLKGFFKIVRGENNLGIEQACNYGVPKDTWSTGKKNEVEIDASSTLAEVEEQREEEAKISK
jgi:cathepsin X